MSDDEGMESESSDFDSGSDEVMEEDLLPVNCLFCNTVSFSVGESAKHCLFEHCFDIRSYIMKRVSSHYDLVKLITYLRQEKPTAKDFEAVGDSKPWASDDYLIPVSPGDPWLWANDGLLADDDEDVEPKYVNAENGVVTLSKEHFDELQEKNQRLEHLLKEQEKNMDALRRLFSEPLDSKDPQTVKHVDTYFDSYSDFDIHREMLRDNPRMKAYKLAIDPNLFKGKIVLDVGCGTGILSMMAVSAGASKVVGVENSNIFDAAVEIVRDNGLASKVTLVKGDIENIELCDEKFDIILSEWMGYFLLFERMLESIVVARDKFLKPDGVMLPSSCTLWLAGCSDPMAYSDRTDSHVMGYSMEPMKRAALSEPAVETITRDKIVTEPVIVHKIDMLDRNSLNSENSCSFYSEFVFKIIKDCELTSICGWFDCSFEPTRSALSTSPFSSPTHWAQTNFYFKEPVKVEAGSSLIGSIKVAPEGDRALQITFDLPSVNIKKTYILH